MAAQTRINVRAVIENGSQVLLCSFVNKKYYFFPGGGVEFGEGAETALRREIQEELGVTVISASFIGAVENLFDHDGGPYHELNLLFSARIDDLNAASKEAHIAFTWIPKHDLERENVLPQHLTSAVVRWLKDGQPFWRGLESLS